MRKFINLVEEAQDATPSVLYHGTSLRALINIAGSDTLLGSEDDNDARGIFCSADLNISKKYIGDHMYDCPEGGVMVLDAAALEASGFTIGTYEYYEGDDGVEYLIDAMERPVKPVLNFVKALLVSSKTADLISHIASRGDDAAFIEDEWEGGVGDYVAAAQKLSRWPIKPI